MACLVWEALHERSVLGRPYVKGLVWEAIYERSGLGGPL